MNKSKNGIVKFLDNNQFIHILQIFSSISILYTILLFLIGRQAAREETINLAWQSFNSANQHQKSNSGRIVSLETLNSTPLILPVLWWDRWERENLSYISINNVDLTGINLGRAILNHANFSQSILTQSDFRRAEIQNAEIIDADFSFSNMQKSNLGNSNFTGSILECVNLSGAEMIEINLHEAILPYSDLSNAILIMADLSEANMYSANLQGSNLFSANLYNVVLEDAYLQGADLSLTRYINTAFLAGAQYSDETKFPADFDPSDYGMIEKNDPVINKSCNG